jgi:hypothetical protein
LGGSISDGLEFIVFECLFVDGGLGSELPALDGVFEACVVGGFGVAYLELDLVNSSV